MQVSRFAVAFALTVALLSAAASAQQPATQPAEPTPYELPPGEAARQLTDAAEEPAEEAAEGPLPLMERETLTDNWFGAGAALEEKGIFVSLSATQIYQQNLDGGLSTHRRSGRYSGSYDLELELDADTLAGLPGGVVYMLASGSWSEGIDASSVASMFGVNGDATGNRSIDVWELWYEQSLWADHVRIRAGKIDLTGGFECRGCAVAFDGNAFANDETAQFLNSALILNPTIPFPDNGLGAAVYVQPLEWWYVSAGFADAQADFRETGFNTAFHDEDHFFAVFETGVTPRLPSSRGELQGAYRVGTWYDPQPKDRFDGRGVERDDMGLYVSLDQMVLKENTAEHDTQGLGLFARGGWADDDINLIRCFWSAGAQYQGLVEGRDADVLAFGVAQGRFTDELDDVRFLVKDDLRRVQSHETAMELYYNIEVAPWVHVTPSVQYIFNPSGLLDDAVVVGLRVQMSF